MKTVLICHHDEPLDREALARWLGSFSELVGLIVVEESAERKWRRLRREVRRIGPLRFLDVLAFRAFYKFALARIDARRMQAILQELVDRYPPLTAGTAILHTATPNAPEAERFLQQCAPDLVIARCKFILRESVFRIPALGTFVLHPGICPEYRNAHGCFWALALRDVERVGVTLLKIDRGVDTGPVYGYFTYAYDERTESHIAIQHRSLLENLDAVAHRLREIGEGRATPLDTSGRHSQEWGQPWLTSYFRWKRSAARRPA